MPKTVKPEQAKLDKVVGYLISKGPSKKKFIQNHIGMKESDLNHVLQWLRTANKATYLSGLWHLTEHHPIETSDASRKTSATP